MSNREVPMVTCTDYQRSTTPTAFRPTSGSLKEAVMRMRAIDMFRAQHGEVPLIAPCRGNEARQNVVIHRCVDQKHQWQATMFLDGQPLRDLRAQDWSELMESAVMQERLDPLQAKPIQTPHRT